MLALQGCASGSSTPTADATPPTAPTSLGATASSSTQIGLTWTASTDNVGVTGYRVERCTGASCTSFAQIGTAGATTFSDSGLTASTSYSYRARATDAAGNLGTFSNTSSTATSPSGGSNIAVTVSPQRGGLTTSQTLSMTASLTNDTGNAGVSWSATGGGIFTSATGSSANYVAPAVAGVVTITATSVADGSKTASATIGVTDLAAVSTYLNGNSRQGANLQEYGLATSGPTAVNSTNFGKLFSCTVDAAIYAQPLWVANVSIGGAKHNVVYVATQHDTVYAFDADASPCTTLWQTGANSVNSLLPSGQTWVTSGDVACTDLQPNIGIVGTPVIDLGTNTMYVVTKSKTTSGTATFHQLLHALDITTGSEKLSGPKEISASVSGTGNGSTSGVVTFDPLINNQRSALLLENGHVVISWSSHCDNGAYHGWVISYSASGLTQEAIWNDSPDGVQGGIWMSGSGPAADSSGNIFFAIGNGSFNANSGTAPNRDYGDSIVKFGPPSGGTFPVAGYFRSFEEPPPPDGLDVDQGSGGVLLLPTTGTKNNLIQAGKDGRIYVTDQTALGGFNATLNSIVQEVPGQLPGGMWGSPTYWSGNIYFGAALDGGATGDPIRAFSFDAGGSGMISGSPTSQTAKSFGFSGPTSPISSSGQTNGILWALDNAAPSNTCNTSCQVLYAYDATNLATQLYNSTQASGNRDQDGGPVKFTVPTVANGKVYAGGQTTLTVYGLLP
jgi:chitodextrinase